MRRAGVIAFVVALVPTAVWLVAAVISGTPATELATYWSTVNVPWAVATWLVWRAWSQDAPNGDTAERLVAVAASTLASDRRDWGRAMGADLAGISDRRERVAYGLDCLRAAALAPRRGRRIAVAYGLVTGAVLGIGLLAASRLASPTGDVVGYLVLGLSAVAFTGGLVAARQGRTYSSGLATVVVATASALVLLIVTSNAAALSAYIGLVACLYLCCGSIGAVIGQRATRGKVAC